MSYILIILFLQVIDCFL